MTAFKPGEIVDVTIKGVRVDDVHPDGTPDIVAEDSDGQATVWALPPQAAVERVAPAEWPPRAGDLWRDRSGVAWFYQDYYASAGDMGGYTQERMVRATGSESYDSLPEFIQARGPLALVHREEPTP